MMMLGRGREDLKSPEIELSNVLLTDSDDGSDLSYEGSVEEEKLEEIMQELYKEITLTTSSCNTLPPPTVTFPSLSSSSSSMPLSLPSLTFFPVCDVNIGESCGASMSYSSTTVMAGVEFVGPIGKIPYVKGEGEEEKEKKKRKWRAMMKGMSAMINGWQAF